ncbi:MAG: hypothetical protein M1830_004978 [Pleopsidium flavum]|nr:MAG: hypothetical protein M1830_004978 [Pleopsidium flavum]
MEYPLYHSRTLIDFAVPLQALGCIVNAPTPGPVSEPTPAARSTQELEDEIDRLMGRERGVKEALGAIDQ